MLVAVAACGPSWGDGRYGDGVGPTEITVGAPCAIDADCVDHCERSDHYPGGMCTLRCRDDLDCPLGTNCIDDSGGICAISCADSLVCRDFGPGYACDDRDRHNGKDKVFVCRAP